jgi:hypothetical protein
MKTIIGLLLLSVFTAMADLPDMPVKVTYRKALTSDGYVFQFHNITSDLLPVKVTLVNPATETQKVFKLVIPAFKQKEIGSLQGWDAVPGDKATIENADYKPLCVEIKKEAPQ